MGLKAMRYMGIALVLALALAIPTFAQNITGSAHDFSAASWNTKDDICSACHTPHNAVTAVSDAPLWSRAAYTNTYSTYTSTTLNASPGAISGVSQLCMSCHDGQVALDVYGSNTTTMADINSGQADLGLDLSGDHPVSFDYTAALASEDGGLNAPSGISLPLFSDSLECATCHDVHNSGNQDYLLRVANTNSDLCLECHDK